MAISVKTSAPALPLGQAGVPGFHAMRLNTPLCVLEFSGSFLRCCRSEMRRRRRIVTHCFTVGCQEGREDNLRVLARQFRRMGFEPVDPVVVIPRHMAAVRCLRLPAQEDRELEDMVRLHIGRQHAFAGDDIVYHYQRNGFDPQGYSLVHVYSLPKTRLERYFSILRRLDIEPSLITWNVQGMMRWLLLQDLSCATAQRSLCLLTAEGDVFDFNVFCDHRLYFSRSFVFSPISGEERAGLLLRELRMSLALCRRLGGVEFIFDCKIYVAGALFLEELQALGASGDFQPVVVRDALAQAHPVLRAMPQEEVFSYASCLGLVLNPTDTCMDMRPASYRERAGEKAASRSWTNAALCVCIILSIVWCLYAHRIMRDAQALRGLKERTIPQTGLMKFGASVAAGAWVEETFIATPVYLEILSDLGQGDGTHVILSACMVQGASRISIKGVGKDMPHVLEYFKSLKERPRFRNSRIGYLVQSKDANAPWPISFKVVSP